MVRDVIRNSKEIAAAWADMLSGAAENYRRQGASKEDSAPDGLRFMARNGETRDAATLTEADLRYLLQQVENRELDSGTYIPIRATTPQFFADVVREHSKGGIQVLPVPMAATVAHMAQNMEQEDGADYGKERPHGFDADDIVAISKGMGDPRYIVLQKNGRYAEVVSFYNKRGKNVTVSVDFAAPSGSNYKYAEYMNGYSEGFYNIVVTEFEPDDLKSYLKNNTVVYDKEKMNGRYQVGSGRIVAVTHDTPFIEDSLNEKDDSVNRKMTRVTAEEDARYLELAKDPEGNRAELESMVRAAAKKAGYITEAYHGTVTGGFTVFDSRWSANKSIAFWFTSNAKMATDEYGTEKPGAIYDWEVNAKTYNVYLKMGNFLKVDAQNSKWSSIPVPEEIRDENINSYRTKREYGTVTRTVAYKGHPVRNPATGAVFNSEANTESYAAYAKVKGYDGVAFENIIDGSVSQKPSTVYAVFSPSQIKSADPVTYDDNGNVIPLSERFNPEKEDIRYSGRAAAYTYDELVSKPDMPVTEVVQSASYNRNDVIAAARKNAADFGHIDSKTGGIVIHVRDIDSDVVIGRKGLKHSLDRRLDVNAPIVIKAGEILTNSVRINELTPKKERASYSYALIGAAQNENGELCIVRSIVNGFSNELTSMDVLYAINAKKESAALLPLPTGKPAVGTDSKISIAKLLDYVNEFFPDVLPEDVLKHYGHESRPDGEVGEYALYARRAGEQQPGHLAEYDVERAIQAQEQDWARQVENIEAMYRGQLEALEEEARSGNDAKGTDTEYDFADDAAEAKKVRDVIRNSKEIAAAWADMLSGAAENYRRQGKADGIAETDNARYSFRDGIITENSTDEERENILKDFPVSYATVNNDRIAHINLEDYNTRKKSEVLPGLKKLAAYLGITNVDLENFYIDFPFQWTQKNVEKSAHHQLDHDENYTAMVKMMSCFNNLVECAIPIETHLNKEDMEYAREPDLKQVYTMMSAFSDGKYLTPVKLTIKEFFTVQPKLYLAVATNKIDFAVLEEFGQKSSAYSPLFAKSAYKLQDIIANVKASNGEFLKYIPDGMLNAEQKISKQESLAKEQQKYEERNRGPMEPRLQNAESNIQGQNSEKRKSTRVTAEEDARYLELAKDPKANRDALDRIINQAAVSWGAAREKGTSGPTAMKYYHGTPAWGFTQFDIAKNTRSNGLIYATAKAVVAANYGGAQKYAGVREIGKPFMEGNSADALINNAKKIFGVDYRKATAEARKAYENKIRSMFAEINDIVDNSMILPGATNELPGWDADDYYDSMANQFDLCMAIAYDLSPYADIWDYDNIKDTGLVGNDFELSLAKDFLKDANTFREKYPDLRGWVIENKDEFIKVAGEDLYNLLTGHKFTDAVIYVNSLYNAIAEKDVLFRAGKSDQDPGSFVTIKDISEAIETSKNIGAYQLYINPGDNVLEVDARNCEWFMIPFQQLDPNDGRKHYFSTDQIAAWARDNGYTSVLFKGVHDGGKPADEYVVFSSNQVKSADAVTYDDAGNVIPLSERFNRENEDIRYSSRAQEEAAKQFRTDVNEWVKDGRPDGRTFILGPTGDVFQGLGAIESDIYMTGDKISTILATHGEMSIKDIKKIPAILNDPVLILKSQNRGRGNSQNTRMVVFGSEKTSNREPILAIFDLRPVEGGFAIEDMQKTVSAYVKTQSPEQFIRNSEIMYADKKRTAPLLRTVGFQMPIELLRSGYIGSINYSNQTVNLHGEIFSDVFRETRGMARAGEQQPGHLAEYDVERAIQAQEQDWARQVENIEAMYRGQLEALEEEARSGNDAKAQSGEIKIPCGTGTGCRTGIKIGMFNLRQRPAPLLRSLKCAAGQPRRKRRAGRRGQDRSARFGFPSAFPSACLPACLRFWRYPHNAA